MTNRDRRQRAAFCSALPYLTGYLTAQGRAAELRDAVTAVLAHTPVQDAVAGPGIPPYALEDGATVRGEEPGAGDFRSNAVPRAEGRGNPAPTEGADATRYVSLASRPPREDTAGCATAPSC